MFQFDERPGSGNTTASPPSLELLYTARGIDGPLTVQALAVGLTAPLAQTQFGLLYRQDVKVSKVGHKLYHVDVPYGPRSRETGQWTWSMDTTGGTVHIKAAKSSVARYPGTAPDHKGLIGVHGDEVDGADIVIPAGKITVEFRHPEGVVTLPFAKFVCSITGTSNSDTFLTCAPGEILFLGGRLSDGSQAEAVAQYEFAYSKNLQNVVIAGIEGITKDGWDLAWISYKPAVDSGKPALQPQAVYVERVYERVALAAALGFGA